MVVGVSRNRKNKPSNDNLGLQLLGNEISKDSSQNKVIPEIMNIDYNLYANKNRYSAFCKTQFENYCKKNDISTLTFAGISSGICVYFSSADAYMRRIMPILVTDASGATDKKIHNQNIMK